jgi:hypothetical protein
MSDNPSAANQRLWNVEIVQTSVIKGVEAPTQEEATRKARDDYAWSDNVVDVRSTCTPYEN